MLSAEARVPTDHAALRLKQVCSHASKMQQRVGSHEMPAGGRHDPGQHGPGSGKQPHSGHRPAEISNVEWSDGRGVIDAEWGQCTLMAEPDALVLRVEAADEERLQRLQEMVAHRVETIGVRDKVKVRWAEPHAGT